ncbi:MAG: arylsulfatase [Acidobacteria bacterium]|nr:arylsulfatase [Acidobacteriota bacterium]MBI3278563.1 arylsulfatase [Acidobacteriota bacterium]
MNRRHFLAAAAGAAAARAQSNRPPNIVLILMDDMGYGDLGCYGQRLIRTPAIDRTATEGARFTDCYAGGAVCAPSRSVLMSGLHTGHSPIRANAGTVPIAAGDVTVAEVLKRAGYTCGGFGKWGLGDAGSTGAPTRHGFDEFFGYLHQTHAHTYYPEFLWDGDKRYDLPGNRNGKRGQYSADLIAERSFEFLRKNRSRPFFLYACYTLPHARFEPPSLAPYEKEPWTPGQKAYASMVTRADTYSGRILQLLHDMRLEDNTVVLISSDNGAHTGEQKGFEFFRSNGRLRGEKGQVYEGGIRVPMIVRWPGRVKAGSVSHFPWSFCDVLPTAAEIAGVKPPQGLDGVSVVPVLTGRGEPKREYLYWEQNIYNQKKQSMRPERLAQAVRIGKWKGLRHSPAQPIEIYDLERDPSETTNVAAQQPALVKRVETLFRTGRTAPRPHSTGTFGRWVS